MMSTNICKTTTGVKCKWCGEEFGVIFRQTSIYLGWREELVVYGANTSADTNIHVKDLLTKDFFYR